MIFKKETQEENSLLTVSECFQVCLDEMLKIYNIKSSDYQTEGKPILGGRQSQIRGLCRSRFRGYTFTWNPLPSVFNAIRNISSLLTRQVGFSITCNP